MLRGFLQPDLPEPDPTDQSHPLAVQLDWDAYFESFKDAHGDPVRWRGVLLFADGWRYSARSKEGPEYPPPDNAEELHFLQTCYWLTRLQLVRAERDFYRDLIRGLRALQRSHSQPLQQQVAAYDEAQGRYQTRAQPVNLDEMEAGRLAWLEQDVTDCEAQLRHLESMSRPSHSFQGV